MMVAMTAFPTTVIISRTTAEKSISLWTVSEPQKNYSNQLQAIWIYAKLPD